MTRLGFGSHPVTGYIGLLLIGLASLGWLASIALEQTTRLWFEKEVTLRAHLAVNGARQALIRRWRSGDSAAVLSILQDIARDERIMAAGACGPSLMPFVSTENFPKTPAFTCDQIVANVRPSDQSPASEWRDWGETLSLPSGAVHVSAIPLIDGDSALGVVVLLQDMKFVERREAVLRRFLLVAFVLLALATWIVPLVLVRLVWRSWSDEIRLVLQGRHQRPEFLPVMQDVRELMERVVTEKESGRGGTWTPERLRETLSHLLHGEKVIVLANREPYIHERRADGTVEVIHPASGLVTALEPVMRACSGVWVAHGSGSADRETADARGRIQVPPGDEAYALRRVWLSPEEEQGYYYGLANEGLWPLCHIADTRPVFRDADWEQYRSVNSKFADAVCEEVDSRDPIILVQDYHFALAPRMIRERLPRATIITFWHIPWPNPERFSIFPWRQELLDGLAGSSILGFHTRFHGNNFLESIERFMEARVDRENDAVVLAGKRTLVQPYPISIEWPNRWAKQLPSAADCRASVLAELGLPADARLGVGVDRLDYTKGIEERLLAVEKLLETCPEWRGRFVFVQLAAPSRTVIEKYRQLNEAVEQLAGRINQRFGSGSYRPIILLRAHHEPMTVFRFYRAADVCYVSSLHDGMNLVAKEFVSARDDEQGVLVLSQFTGAARELTEALIVNPFDRGEASRALAAALRMSSIEQRERLRSMRALIAEFNVYRWAGRMLEDGARLRRNHRLTSRLMMERMEDVV